MDPGELWSLGELGGSESEIQIMRPKEILASRISVSGAWVGTSKHTCDTTIDFAKSIGNGGFPDDLEGHPFKAQPISILTA
jgi:hypothetical protein